MDTLSEFRSICKHLFETAENRFVNSRKRAAPVKTDNEAEVGADCDAGEDEPPKRDFIAAQVQQLYYRMKNKK